MAVLMKVVYAIRITDGLNPKLGQNWDLRPGCFSLPPPRKPFNPFAFPIPSRSAAVARAASFTRGDELSEGPKINSFIHFVWGWKY